MTVPDDLTKYLDPLGLGAWRYFPVVGSTNDRALDWAKQEAPDWALVVADAQTAGRGRGGRRWVTAPGHSLAISLILRLSATEAEYFSRLAALGALGLIRALSGLGLVSTLKWPNDVLLAGCKVGGVLVEANWHADQVEAVVIGLGVNISPQSVPSSEVLRYPATAIETVLGNRVDRWALLSEIVRAMQDYRGIIADDAFIEAWNVHLAWRNEWIRFQMTDEDPQTVRLLGVLPDGRLSLQARDGKRIEAVAGEIILGAEQH